jgi:putative phosphoribosyl transferase
MTGTVPGQGEIVFANRRDAGRRLASLLAPLRDEQPIVLALPRGGAPVAAQVAQALGAPLDVIVVRKLGLPFQPELGFGAIGEGGVRFIDSEMVHRAGLTERDIARVEAKERRELDRRIKRYRGDRAPIAIEGRTVVLVDDGLATGVTARTAVRIARAGGARRDIVAVPVAPSETIKELQTDADQVVSLVTPPHFVAVGPWYRDFEQISDAEVATVLREGAGVYEPD